MSLNVKNVTKCAIAWWWSRYGGSNGGVRVVLVMMGDEHDGCHGGCHSLVVIVFVMVMVLALVVAEEKMIRFNLVY